MDKTKDIMVGLVEKMDDFFEEKYVALDICDVFYKVTRGFLNTNEEEHIGIGIHPNSDNTLTIHFLKYNAKGDRVKIDSRRNLVMCPITDCLLKSAMELAKLKRSDDGLIEGDYIQ